MTLDADHWLKQLNFVKRLDTLKNILRVTGRTNADVMALNLENFQKYVVTNRFSMIDDVWDVVDIFDLNLGWTSGINVVVKIERNNVVVKIERNGKEQADWGWQFLMLLRQPLAFSRVLSKVRTKGDRYFEWGENESDASFHLRMKMALIAFSEFIHTATDLCWIYFDVAEMELGITFVNENDCIAYEALRIAFSENGT